MKIISWNVNGIKSTLEKGLISFMKEQQADIYLFQETKTSLKRVVSDLKNIEGYYDNWSSATKKGYSGVVSYSNKKPLSIKEGIGVKKFDEEGRILTLEYDAFYILNVYFVNAGRGLKRLHAKKNFNREFMVYCENLREEKPLIIGGDFNVAHKEKDLANPDSNSNNAGFTPEERSWFTKFLNKGYIDTFREFEDEGGKYTFWSYMHNAREKDIGWRLDYFVITEPLKDKLTDSYRLPDIMGSDHCPIALKIEIDY
ncbi:MAG: exodeoxyribonuclease III [Candidatus Lokiarchaeota archaeon]|nr:exodeoxyribonuclease III [Candidatus Lokiarchaeota archaeon]